MKIDVQIRPVAVEIDGSTYPVAVKTVAVADRLAKISAAPETPRYQIWLDQLRVVLGKAAVSELFANGKKEDLDRMEAIYAGVMGAFDHNGKELRGQREKAELDHLHDLAATLSTISDKVGEIYGKYPGIARPKEA